MLSKKRLFAATALVFLGFLGVSRAKASPAKADDDDTKCYTAASLNGTYAVVATYGSNVALALAIRHFDGKGNLTGTFTLNEPDPASSTGGRKIVTGTQVGTYTVNCDGTGVITRTVTASNGVTATQMDDFVITKATVIPE